MKGFGTRGLGDAAPVDSHTIFTLASTSKAFVATAIGILVDDGKLKFDDPVIRYIPEFRVADPYVTREITIRDLLTHRTGVRQMDILWVRGFDRATSIEHMRNATQASSLRSTWAYNNMMYVVAAEIVTRVSGLPLQDFVQRRLFAPLAMNDSVFSATQMAQRPDVAGAHLIEEGAARAIPPYTSDAPVGAAGIHTSVADMTRWIRMLLAQGSFEGRQIVNPATVAETLRPQMLLSNIEYPAAREAHPHFYAYGLGWFVQDYKGHVLNMHTGSIFGANALVALVPDMRLGLVILINAEPVEYRHAFMYDIVDRYLGQVDRDWNADLQKVYGDLHRAALSKRAELEAKRVPDVPRGGELNDYIGQYDDALAGDSQIVAAGDRLLLLMPPDGRFSLNHWSYDTFEASDTRAPADRFMLTFRRGADGTVNGYEVDGQRSVRRMH